MERTSKPNIAILGLDKNKRFVNLIRDDQAKECSNLKIVRIEGFLYFGSIEKIADYFTAIYDENKIQYMLIAADGINFIDLAAAEWLTNEIIKWQNNRGGIYIAGLKIISQDVLQKGGFVKKVGEDIFFKEKKEAIVAIHKLIKQPCKQKVFDECSIISD
jgi:SulP family sulfate permease